MKNLLNEIRCVRLKSVKEIHFDTIREIEKIKKMYLFNANMVDWFDSLGMNNAKQWFSCQYENSLEHDAIEKIEIYPCMSFED